MNSDRPESTQALRTPQAGNHPTPDTIRARIADEFAKRHGSTHEVTGLLMRS